MRSMILVSTALLLGACTAGPAADFSKVLPDDSLKVNMPVTGSTRSNTGDVSEYWALTAEASTDINSMVGMVTDMLEEITSYDPTWADDQENTALWGPWEDAGNDFQLWVAYDEKADTYSWAIEAAPTGSGDFTALIAGNIDEGATDDTGSGVFVLDFGAVAALDASASERGVFAVEYVVTKSDVEVTAGFEGFSDNHGETLHDIAYHYGQERKGGGYMDLALTQDVTGNTVQELSIIRTRWDTDGAGRADVFLTDGDFGPLTYNATECWGDDALVSFYEDNADFHRSGDEAACVFDEPSWNESDGV